MTAIGSISSTSTASQQSTVSRVALRADLARYEKQLSDCVNCASAKTPEGKRNIQDLDTRISALKARLNFVPQSDSTATVNQKISATEPPWAGGRVDVYA